MKNRKLVNEVNIEGADNCILILKKEMTALEIINLVEALEEKADELLEMLIESCSECDDCENCGYCDSLGDDFYIPDWAKLEAGLKEDTKLMICVEEDSGVITLEPVGHSHDLTDVSADMKDRLKGLGICLGELNEQIMMEENDYGE